MDVYTNTDIDTDTDTDTDTDVIEELDVWLDLCYHSHLAPLRTSSDLHPELLLAGAGHHWDSYGILNVSAEPLFIQQAHLWEIRTVQKWLSLAGKG